MQLGMIGLGRMGANMVRRLLSGGHQCVVHDAHGAAAPPLVDAGATAATALDDFVARLRPPRTVWLMVPAGAVDAVIADVAPRLEKGDVLVDGGNSHYADDIRRARELAVRGIDYVDVGTSGGVWGRERGYCLMIGGPVAATRRLEPIFRTLAPGRGGIAPTSGRAGRSGTADEGFLHCGPAGAGHFVKMVHNGIEYGLMAAYAEGLNVLRHAGVGKAARAVDAETTPLRHPEHFQYDFDLADIAEVWRRGSVVASWLLDLTAGALAEDPELDGFSGEVADSGEGRWTVEAAIQQGSPVPVLSAALYQRFASRERDLFARKVLSAMRQAFGGHAERAAPADGGRA
jgi:6-phosphogluconate dehydrogenase